MVETIEPKVKKADRKFPIYAVAFFLLGVISIVGIRFVNIRDTSVHYHANFSLYINGQRDEFDSFTFYEEIQACGSDDANNIKARVHMHDKNSSLIHVHDSGVSWGQFFANLGYGLSNKSVTTDDGVFVEGVNGDKLSFMLNGKPVSSIANELIKSEDTLLINYGKDPGETLINRFDSIPKDSRDANTKNDPATCSGGHELTTFEKLKQAIGVSQASSGH